MKKLNFDYQLIQDDINAELACFEIEKLLKEKEEKIKKIDEMIDYYNLKKEEVEIKINEKIKGIENNLINYSLNYKKEELNETKTQFKLKLATKNLILKKPTNSIKTPGTSVKNKLILEFPEFVKKIEEFDFTNFKKNLEIIDDKVVFKKTGEILDLEIELKKMNLKIN